ncbi:MAG: hypothetical protein J5811_06615 [Lachnospiraceae bacterium]|nr:hypothetical protein [Lachnospiraceae bacterium]
MNQMNKLLKRYGTKKFEELLAGIKLGELLEGKSDDDDDILKWVLICVGAVVVIASVVCLTISIIKKVEKKRIAQYDYDDFDEVYGSEEE